MERDPLDSQGTSTADFRPLTGDAEQEEPVASENAREPTLRPQEMPKSELSPLPPRPREQALPEKGDDRFFDRWVVDKARELGLRAVRQPAIERLQQATRSFADWRGLRHQPAAERASLEDRALVASTTETIKKATAEAKRLGREAEVAEREAKVRATEAEIADKQRTTLRPALRGSSSDLALTLIANFVVLAVDVFIIHIALERLPGDPREYWATAVTMGAGAVVIGDALGWIAATGAVGKDGSFSRPGRPTIAAVAGLLIVAVWFFFELGAFREEALAILGEKGNLDAAEPSFFTAGQILFLLGAAVTSFAFVARRHGREVHEQHEKAVKRRDDQRAAVSSLRKGQEEAWMVATAAPALRKEAEERIKAREKIAKNNAALDKKQGEYLEALIVPEYARERAGIESGVLGWQLERGSRSGLSMMQRAALAILSGLFGAGIAYIGFDHYIWPTALFGAIFASAAFALSRERPGEVSEDDGERYQRYVAKLTLESEERVTDIQEMVPFPRSGSAPETNGRVGDPELDALTDQLKREGGELNEAARRLNEDI